MAVFCDILLYVAFALATCGLIVWYILFRKKVKALLSENDLDEDLPKRKRKAFIIGIYIPIIVVAPLFALAVAGFLAGNVPKTIEGEIEGSGLAIAIFIPLVFLFAAVYLLAKRLDKYETSLAINVPDMTESEFCSDISGEIRSGDISSAGKRTAKKYFKNAVKNIVALLFLEAIFLYTVIMLFTFFTIVYRTGLLVVVQ